MFSSSLKRTRSGYCHNTGSESDLAKKIALAFIKDCHGVVLCCPTKDSTTSHIRSHPRDLHTTVGTGRIFRGYLQSLHRSIQLYSQRLGATLKTLNLFLHFFSELGGGHLRSPKLSCYSTVKGEPPRPRGKYTIVWERTHQSWIV